MPKASTRSNKLRLGLLLDRLEIPAWQYKIVELISYSSFASIELVVVQKEKKKPPLPLPLRLYLDYDLKKYPNKPNPLENKDLSQLLGNVDVISSIDGPGDSQSETAPQTTSKVAEYRLDVILNLSSRLPTGEVLTSAHMGVWTFYFGDYNKNRRGPDGFYEVLENQPYLRSALLLLGKGPKDHKILYESFASVCSHSVSKSLQRIYWKSLSFVPRVLKELYELGEVEFISKINAKNESTEDIILSPQAAPGWISSLQMVSKQLTEAVAKKFTDLLFDKGWIILYDFSGEDSMNGSRFKKLVPPKGKSWADPFIDYVDQTHYVFFEEIVNKKGHISVLTLDEDGQYQNVHKVIEKPYHLSYPYILDYGGEKYMIPESSANRTIEAYRCVEFPNQWELHKVLMQDIQAADATLFHHKDKWWMFVNVREYEGYPNWDELHLYYADSPLSANWTPHPLNPIVSDVRSARPAGNIFEKDGNIYRPSQNSSYIYGYGLKINQILKLSETEYEEQEVSSIEPSWDKSLHTIHTLNQANQLTLADSIYSRLKYFKRRKKA